MNLETLEFSLYVPGFILYYILIQLDILDQGHRPTAKSLAQIH